MHLAICDDNIADRKQMERLLQREADRRIAGGTAVYVESFGSRASLLCAPRIYDALFLDLTCEGEDAGEVARMLRADGARIPIVLCCGSIDHRQDGGLPENCLFLDKPIKTAELTAMVDALLERKRREVHTMEFRNDAETFYLTEPEILYAVPDGRFIAIHLTDGTVRQTTTGFSNFCSYLAVYPAFHLANSNAAVNLRYLSKITPFEILLNEGTSFSTTPLCASRLKKALRRFEASLQEKGNI